MTNSDVDKNKDLNIWLARVKQAKTRKDVFKILDEFRKFEWTDVQCQTMSHLYMRMIDLMPPEEDVYEVASVAMKEDTKSGGAAPAPVAAPDAAPAAAAATAEGTPAAVGAEGEGGEKKAVINEGPVWYEKM